MSKNRTIANLGTGFVNITDTGTEGTKVASGTTAQRGSTAGQLRFNTTTGLAEYYTGTAFKSIDSPPTVSSISPTTSYTANENITISGSNFQTGVTVTFIGNDGTSYSSPSVTRNSDTQIVAQTPNTALTASNEPYDVKVLNASGLSGILSDALDAGSSPAFSTASGSLGNVIEGASTSFSVSATDADGQTVTYALQSGSLPTGYSLNTSTGAITGTAPTVSADTTSTFTIRASAGGDTTDRSFSITVKNLTVQTFSYTGSDQTFTVPSGVTSITAYMWGAAGAAGYNYSGSGGGGRSSNTGGAGGFTTGTISTSAGTVYKLVVGEGGTATDVTAGFTASVYGGGGRGRVHSHAGIGGGGGGYSGIFLTSVSHGNSVLIAGGGAGAVGEGTGSNDYPGNGGGSTGQDGGLNNSSGHNSNGVGHGGTQSAGGAAGAGDAYSNQPGSALQGGDGGHMGGGGGGGYYGGGAGGHTNGHGSSGSGGGSGYIGHSSVSNGTTTGATDTAYSGTKNPPQTSSTHYATGIGRGNQGANGGNGRIVLVYA